MNATPDLRAPHRATRTLVETEGQEAARALYDLFELYNRTHFAAKLEQALILIIEPTSRRSLGDYCARDAQGLRSRIRIAPRVFDEPGPKSKGLGEKGIADVLLHEMVHAWMEEVEADMESGYRAHGPKFAAKCNEIGKTLGLPEVAEKGRHGKPDCAHWPFCVRPAGYYATAWEAPKRAKKSEPEPEPTASDDSEDLDDDDDGAGPSPLLRVRALLSKMKRDELHRVIAMAADAAAKLGGDA